MNRQIVGSLLALSLGFMTGCSCLVVDDTDGLRAGTAMECFDRLLDFLAFIEQ